MLGMQSYKPKEFASQLNLDMVQCWGILKSFVDIFLSLQAGRYVILRDPNAAKIRIYDVPSGQDDSEGEEEYLEEGEEGEESAAKDENEEEPGK
jgi:translation initiation factor 3 subunit D